MSSGLVAIEAKNTEWRRWLLVWLSTAVVYILLGKLCLALGAIGGTASPFWLPAGLVVAFSLRLGYGALPGIFVGEWLVGVFFEPGPQWKHLVIAGGNMLEGWAVILLAPRLMHGHDLFGSLRNFFGLFGAALAGSVCNATVGAASLWLSGLVPLAEFGNVMLHWSIGDLGGALIVAPLLLSGIEREWREWRGMRLAELVLVAAVACGLTHAIFSDLLALPSAPLAFLLLPVLLWASFRLGPAACALVNALLMGFAIWGTTHGYGPFVAKTPTDSLVLIQLFTSVLIVTSLVALIVNRERKRAAGRLRLEASLLEEKVRQRTGELREAMLMANAASMAKSEFLANMSHEIRTPLNAVLGLAHLLGSTRLEPQQRDYVEKIQTAGRALLHIISDILDFSKIEAGRMELEHADFALEDIFDTLETIASANLRDKPVGIRFDIAPEVPRYLVGDRLRLQQVLMNLLGNAIKFTERGSIQVGVALDGSPGDTVLLKFWVQDTGIGIDPSQLERLFQPFTQADASTTRRYGGTGLGLAISRRIVELMGGRIEVESRPGAGSTFHFTLPFRRGRPPEAAAEQAGEPELAGLRVLLVEDNPINRVVAREILERAGAEVVTAVNGREALEKLDTEIAAVLMDLQMPEMDGFEAARRIRAQGHHAGLPIIAMTANVMKSDVQACLEAGMNDHVAKPVDAAELKRVILHWTRPEAELPVSAGKTKTAMSPASPAGVGPAVLDRAGAIVRMGIDEALYDEVLGIFPQEYAGMRGRLRSAVEAGDWDGARHEVHTLKGLAANIGAEGMAEAAYALELAIRHGETDVAALLQALEQRADQVLALISSGN